MPDAPRLEVDRLSCVLNGRTILDDVSLQLATREMVGLVGPNGAGKTTLLRAISGSLGSAEGRVRIEATPLERMDRAEVARVVAQVPQSTVIDFGFSCLEVVLMGRHPHLGRFAQEGPADYRLAESAMAYTGTLDLAERLVTEVSGGERQQVVAARALTQQPRVLLLDEPTANLDVFHRLQLLDLVRDLVRQQGLSAVAAIHDLELAARYCDRLVLLKNGRVLATGSPAQVLTPERIFEGFGARALVRPEPLTGALDIVFLPNRSSAETADAPLHKLANGRSSVSTQPAGEATEAGRLPSTRHRPIAAIGNAIRFLTVFPVGDQRAGPTWLTLASFPLIGACLGLLATAFDQALQAAVPPLAGAALVLGLLAVLSGGLHLDGLMDSFDGLFGGRDPAQRLEIMRDSRLGSYGAVAAIVVLLLQLTFLADVHASWRVGALISATVLGRWAMVYALAAFPYGRPAGLGAAFKAVAGTRALVAATLLAGAVVVAVLGPAGAGMMGLAWLATWLMARYALGRVPGLTGDLYGALNELVFTLILIVVVFLQGQAARPGW